MNGVNKEEMDKYFDQLRIACSQYYNFSDNDFERFKEICFIKEVKKAEILLDNYSKAKFIYFICKGILRTYYLDESGKIYTKNLFSENYFSASKVSLLTNEDSYLNIVLLLLYTVHENGQYTVYVQGKILVKYY